MVLNSFWKIHLVFINLEKHLFFLRFSKVWLDVDGI
jgi:hypothetical protein